MTSSPQGLGPRRSPYLVDCAILTLTSLLFTLQIFAPVLHRVGGWDELWSDARILGGLIELKRALAHGELPVIDFYRYFGWHLGGDIFSVWQPPNLLVLFFSPETVFAIRTWLYFLAGAVGSYGLIHSFTQNRNLSLLAGLLILPLPLNIGIYRGHSFIFGFLLAPALLWALHSWMKRPRSGAALVFFLLCMAAAGSADFNGFVIFLGILPAFTLGLSRTLGKTWQATAGWIALTLAFFFVAGAYYYVPVFENFHQNSTALKEVFAARITIPPPAPYNRHELFSTLFWKNGWPTLFEPVTGSGTVFYVSIALWGLIPIWLLLLFAGRLSKGTSSEKGHVWLAGGLILSLFLMWLGPTLLYSPVTVSLFPKIAEVSQGVLRYQLNWIPYCLVVLGCLVLHQLPRLEQRVPYGAVLWRTGLGLLFLNHVRERFQMVWGAGDRSPLFGLNTLSLPQSWAPTLFTLCELALLIFILWPRRPESSLKILQVAGPVVALVYTTAMGQVYHPHGGDLRRSDFHKNAYLKRHQCIENLTGGRSERFRTLHSVGAQEATLYTGLTYKNHLDLELDGQFDVRSVFSYREASLPYNSIHLGMASADTSWISNQRTPPAEVAIAAPNYLRLLGVQTVVNAGEALPSKRPKAFQFLGECSTNLIESRRSLRLDQGPPSPVIDRMARLSSGSIFVYAMDQPVPIVSVFPNAKQQTPKQMLKEMIQSPEPFATQILRDARLPVDFVLPDQTESVDASITTPDSVRFGSQSLTFEVQGDAPTWALVTYHWRPHFEAWVDDKPVPVVRAAGVFLGVPVPAGKHTIRVAYRPWEFYWGAVVTGMGLFGLIGFLWNGHRRRNIQKEQPV